MIVLLVDLVYKHQGDKGNKMFKINATELDRDIQKKLAKLIDGRLAKGLLNAIAEPV